MFDTPFTNIIDQGVLSVFGENESKKIVDTLQQVNRNVDVARLTLREYTEDPLIDFYLPNRIAGPIAMG